MAAGKPRGRSCTGYARLRQDQRVGDAIRPFARRLKDLSDLLASVSDVEQRFPLPRGRVDVAYSIYGGASCFKAPAQLGLARGPPSRLQLVR